MAKIKPGFVLYLLDFLDKFDSVSIEENKIGADVTLEHIKSTNSGNNCIHIDLVRNNHRIVIQTYKEMNHETVDIVQGKVELELLFHNIIDIFNTNNLSDNQLNQIFVLYCGLWMDLVSSCWSGSDEGVYVLEFGLDISLTWADDWFINTSDAVRFSQLQKVIDFIAAVNNICDS